MADTNDSMFAALRKTPDAAPSALPAAQDVVSGELQKLRARVDELETKLARQPDFSVLASRLSAIELSLKNRPPAPPAAAVPPDIVQKTQLAALLAEQRRELDGKIAETGAGSARAAREISAALAELERRLSRLEPAAPGMFAEAKQQIDSCRRELMMMVEAARAMGDSAASALRHNLAETAAHIEKRIAGLELLSAALDGLRKDVSALGDKSSRQQEAVSALSEKLAVVQEGVAQLRRQSAGLEAAVKAIPSDTDSRVADIEEKLSGLPFEIEKTGRASADAQSGLARLSAELEKAVRHALNMESRLAAIAASAVESKSGAITDMAGGIKSLGAEIAYLERKMVFFQARLEDLSAQALRSRGSSCEPGGPEERSYSLIQEQLDHTLDMLNRLGHSNP